MVQACVPGGTEGLLHQKPDESKSILTHSLPKIALVDPGYHGIFDVCGTRLMVSHTRRPN